MIIDKPFSLLLEGPIDNGDGKQRNPTKHFECTCVITSTEQGPRLLVKAVDDMEQNAPISDEQDIPAIQRILEAAKLAEWCENHAEVFTEGKVM